MNDATNNNRVMFVRGNDEIFGYKELSNHTGELEYNIEVKRPRYENPDIITLSEHEIDMVIEILTIMRSGSKQQIYYETVTQ